MTHLRAELHQQLGGVGAVGGQAAHGRAEVGQAGDGLAGLGGAAGALGGAGPGRGASGEARAAGGCQAHQAHQRADVRQTQGLQPRRQAAAGPAGRQGATFYHHGQHLQPTPGIINHGP